MRISSRLFSPISFFWPFYIYIMYSVLLLWRSLKNEKESNYFFPFLDFQHFSASLRASRAGLSLPVQKKRKKKQKICSLSRPQKLAPPFALSAIFCPSPKRRRRHAKISRRFHFERKERNHGITPTRKNKIKSANIFTSLFKNALYILYYIYALRNSLSFILSLRHRCSLSWGCFFLLSSKNDVGNNVQTRDAVFFFRQRQQQHESFEIENFIFFFFEK